MTELSRPPKPELLLIRWVCGVCLKTVHEKLTVSWTWERDHTIRPSSLGSRPNYWIPNSVEGPFCHGLPMLVLGEPKKDVHGLRAYGLMIDPLDEMYCPKASAA